MRSPTLPPNEEDRHIGADADDTLRGTLRDEAFFGGNGGDQLSGEAGDDLLNGGSGADTMIGGAGNDVYIVDNILDRVHEFSGGGRDEVRASISYTLGDDVEILKLLGRAAIDGAGNDASNVILGNSGDNHLDGHGGGDRIEGRGGNDAIDGGEGRDRIFGGAGHDTIDGGEGRDRIFGGAGDDIVTVTDIDDLVLDGGDGFDRLTIDWTGRAETLPDLSAIIRNFEAISIVGVPELTIPDGNQTVTFPRLPSQGLPSAEPQIIIIGEVTIVGKLTSDGNLSLVQMAPQSPSNGEPAVVPIHGGGGVVNLGGGATSNTGVHLVQSSFIVVHSLSATSIDATLEPPPLIVA